MTVAIHRWLVRALNRLVSGQSGRVITRAAATSLRADPDGDGVLSRTELRQRGFDAVAVRAQVAARRWRLAGLAVVTHNSELTRRERWRATLINCGPHALLTSFSAAEAFGLSGWEREAVHVLVPRGARIRRVTEVSVVVHRARDWASVRRHAAHPWHRLAPAVVVAAGSFGTARPACGLLAAAVQQRLLRAESLELALVNATRVRHRRLLLVAVADIAMGAHALSEIDFAALCHRHALPQPERQAVRPSPGGRRRYLDAEWTRADGRRVVAEVDGAIHLQPINWVADQMRQNEVTLSNSLVLRFPAIVLRTDEATVAGQLRRALGLPTVMP